jgi:LysR family transcriptional regulator, hydrogen peroxide-inducible genes activator
MRSGIYNSATIAGFLAGVLQSPWRDWPGRKHGCQDMTMELQQLRYFCSVVRYGSFTKAAEQEGIAQPTLSLQIRRLEKSVGSTLFVRLARSVRLTHAGEIFYSHAKEIISRSRLAETQVRQLEDGIGGPLRIGAIPTVLPYLLAPHLPEFSTLYPQVDIILTEDVTSNLIDKLCAGDLDVIIVSLPLRRPDLVCSELLREPLVLVAPKEHTLCHAQPTKLDLSGERLLLLKEGHCFRDDMLIACRRGSAEMAPVFESDHFGSIFPLVASGAGVTIAPQMAAAQASGCAVLPFPKEQWRRIGYARLKSSLKFKTLTAFTKWMRTLSESIAKHSRS